MAAPGHNPGFLYRSNDRVRMDVDRALDLVKDGRGDQSFTGPDNNQGNAFTVTTTAAIYASWMNPRGKAAMEAQAPRLPAGVPLLMIVGDRDPAYGHARSSWYAPAAIAREPTAQYHLGLIYLRGAAVEDAKIGLPVEVIFERVADDIQLPQFRIVKP